jgi:hypothetical protein
MLGGVENYVSFKAKILLVEKINCPMGTTDSGDLSFGLSNYPCFNAMNAATISYLCWKERST